MSDSGIHHVTAIAGSPQRNLDFYRRVLGLRLIKKTVNFDDPGSYHLYYGDDAGRPGTILTFFPWEQAAPGRAGSGEVQETVFRIPLGAVEYWSRRLQESGVASGAHGAVWRNAAVVPRPRRSAPRTGGRAGHRGRGGGGRRSR